MRIDERIGFDDALDRGQRDALRAFRTVAHGGERQSPLLNLRLELGGLGEMIDQAPVERLLAAHAFARRAEHVGEIVADMALVGEARQAAGAWQHAEERDFWEADGAATVVHRRISSQASASS